MKDGYTHITDDLVRALGERAALLSARIESFTNEAGEARVSMDYIMAAFGWSEDKTRRVIGELRESGLWQIEAGKGRGNTTFFKRLQKHHLLENKKGKIFAAKRLQKCDLSNNSNTIIIKTIEKDNNNVLPSSTAPMPASVCEEPATKEPKKVFRKPTVEEVRAYCEERHNGIDPEHWFDYYESNGWMVGRSHMKDWRAAVRTWEAKDKERNNKKSNHYGRPHTSPAEAARAAALGIALADAELADV